ncbi:phage tail protein [Pseudomonas sp.]|uniref:phage tail protein n=1 Tax=Pseudomonas sp. TaxID=306 RepID=UPI00273427C4|nr:phage tail protein [Pseudomonas sp.]MDP2747959.1 phage tail protein [Pseudomonas sp.]
MNYQRIAGTENILRSDGAIIPNDPRNIDHQAYLQWLEAGNTVAPADTGEAVTAQMLCMQIDAAADSARSKVAGDPLRAVEYDRAAEQAQAFKDANYPAGAVPRMVSAWAIGGRTPKQAADNILIEAAQYNEALYLLRETRLQAKELVRQAMQAGNVEQAQDIAAETIASIKAAVAGIGNNAG